MTSTEVSATASPVVEALHGVLPAVVLPLDDKAQIDEVALRALVSGLVAVGGVSGLVVNAIAGEGPLLSDTDALTVLDATVDEVGSAVPVLAGIAAESPREARRRVELAAQRGARGVLVSAPASFSRGIAQRPDVALAYFEEVARGGLPMIVFQHQLGTGRSYPVDLLCELASLDGVVAVKETTWDLRSYERDVRALRQRTSAAVLCANDDLLLGCLTSAQPDGLLLGLASLVPELISELLSATQAGDLVTARHIHDRMAPLVSAIYSDPPLGYYPRMKAALVMRGWASTENMLPPLGPVSEEERAVLRAALEVAGVLDG